MKKKNTRAEETEEWESLKGEGPKENFM